MQTSRNESLQHKRGTIPTVEYCQGVCTLEHQLGLWHLVSTEAARKLNSLSVNCKAARDVLRLLLNQHFLSANMVLHSVLRGDYRSYNVSERALHRQHSHHGSASVHTPYHLR